MVSSDYPFETSGSRYKPSKQILVPSSSRVQPAREMLIVAALMSSSKILAMENTAAMVIITTAAVLITRQSNAMEIR